MLGTNEHLKSMEMVLVTWSHIKCTAMAYTDVLKWVQFVSMCACVKLKKSKWNEIAFLEEMRMFLQSNVSVKQNKESCMFRRALFMYSR